MIIKIDNREKQLIHLIPELLKENNLKNTHSIEIEAIDIGDVIIYDKNRNMNIIIERKKLSDLASSIRDGRYSEQSLRLHHLNHHNHNIYYLIEGNMKYYSPKYTKVTPKTLYSAMISLNYYKGFSVFRTFDIYESAEFIIRIADKIYRESKNSIPFYSNVNQSHREKGMNNNSNCNSNSNCNYINNNNNNNEKSILKDNFNTNNKKLNLQYQGNYQNNQDNYQNNQQNYKLDIPYSNVVKKVKKENITPENIGEIILSQIPGISNVISLAIMKSFGSLYNLMKSLSENHKCLHDFKYTTTSGNERRISKKAIESIITYLLYQRDTIINIE